MAKLHYEKPTKERPWLRDETGGWARYYLKPFEFVYGHVKGNREIPDRKGWPVKKNDTVGWCEPDAPTSARRLALTCSGCYEGRTGPFCETPKQAFCLARLQRTRPVRWRLLLVRKGWAGIDCSESVALYSA